MCIKNRIRPPGPNYRRAIDNATHGTITIFRNDFKTPMIMRALNFTGLSPALEATDISQGHFCPGGINLPKFRIPIFKPGTIQITPHPSFSTNRQWPHQSPISTLSFLQTQQPVVLGVEPYQSQTNASPSQHGVLLQTRPLQGRACFVQPGRI